DSPRAQHVERHHAEFPARKGTQPVEELARGDVAALLERDHGVVETIHHERVGVTRIARLALADSLHRQPEIADTHAAVSRTRSYASTYCATMRSRLNKRSTRARDAAPIPVRSVSFFRSPSTIAFMQSTSLGSQRNPVLSFSIT